MFVVRHGCTYGRREMHILIWTLIITAAGKRRWIRWIRKIHSGKRDWPKIGTSKCSKIHSLEAPWQHFSKRNRTYENLILVPSGDFIASQLRKPNDRARSWFASSFIKHWSFQYPKVTWEHILMYQFNWAHVASARKSLRTARNQSSLHKNTRIGTIYISR